MEVKHHCSIPANPLIPGLKMVSLVIRFLGWMTFSRMGTYFSWKVTTLQNFTYFDAVVVLPKKKTFQRNTPNQRARFLKSAFGAHLPITALCSSCTCGTTYSPGARELKQQRLLWGNARSCCTDITGILATDFSRVMISCRTLLPLDSGFNYTTFH